MNFSHGLKVDNFGTKWLLQNRKASNAVGLMGEPPFPWKGPKTGCPHDFRVEVVQPVSQLNRDQAALLSNDPFGKYMVPNLIPDHELYNRIVAYQPERINEAVWLANRLATLWNGQSGLNVLHVRQLTYKLLNERLHASNLVPLVITHLSLNHQSWIDEIARSIPSQYVILIGDQTCLFGPEITLRVETTALNHSVLSTFDLPALGNVMMRELMRS